MSNGVGVTRSERKDILLERIANARNLIAAHEELAEVIRKAEARSVSHQQVWNKVARRLMDDANEIRKELEQCESRLAANAMAERAAEHHIPVRTNRIVDLIESPPLPQTETPSWRTSLRRTRPSRTASRRCS